MLDVLVLAHFFTFSLLVYQSLHFWDNLFVLLFKVILCPSIFFSSIWVVFSTLWTLLYLPALLQSSWCHSPIVCSITHVPHLLFKLAFSLYHREKAKHIFCLYHVTSSLFMPHQPLFKSILLRVYLYFCFMTERIFFSSNVFCLHVCILGQVS